MINNSVQGVEDKLKSVYDIVAGTAEDGKERVKTEL